MEPIGIALAIFTVLATVTTAIANPLSAALIRARARRLPLQFRSRLEEEWLAELDAMPYPWDRLLFAISLAISRQRSFAHSVEGTAETRTHRAFSYVWSKCAHFLLEVGIGFLPFLLIELIFRSAGLSTEMVFIFGACLPWDRWSCAGTDVEKPGWRWTVLMKCLLVPLIPEVFRQFYSGGMGVVAWAFLFPFCFPHTRPLLFLQHLKRAKGETNGWHITPFLKEFFLWIPFALVVTGIVHELPSLTGFSENKLFMIQILMFIPIFVLLLAVNKYRRAVFVSNLSSWTGLNKQDAPTDWRLGMNTSNVCEVPLAHPSGARQYLQWCLGVIGFYVVYGGFYWIGLGPVLPGPGYLPLVVTSFLLCVSLAGIFVGFHARGRVRRCSASETIEAHWEQPETLRDAGAAWTGFSGSAIVGIIGFFFTGMTVSLVVGAAAFLLLLLSGPRWLTPTRKAVSA